MSQYLRPRTPGACVYFTVALADPGADTLIRSVGALRAAVRQTLADRPFRIDAWVVLPDHMHCVWTLPPGDADYSTRWSLIKARFSRTQNISARRPSQIARRERGVWQRRFWEHHLRSPAEINAAIRHCWTDPVRHGLVEDPLDWDLSSIHRDLRPGWGNMPTGAALVTAPPLASLRTNGLTRMALSVDPLQRQNAAQTRGSAAGGGTA